MRPGNRIGTMSAQTGPAEVPEQRGSLADITTREEFLARIDSLRAGLGMTGPLTVNQLLELASAQYGQPIERVLVPFEPEARACGLLVEYGGRLYMVLSENVPPLVRDQATIHEAMHLLMGHVGVEQEMLVDLQALLQRWLPHIDLTMVTRFLCRTGFTSPPEQEAERGARWAMDEITSPTAGWRDTGGDPLQKLFGLRPKSDRTR